MTITRYTRRSPFRSPWLEVEDMSSRLHRLFGESSQGEGAGAFGWSPVVSVQEASDGLLLTAELPGLSIEDIEIEVENNVLSLKGEKKEETEETDELRFHVRERGYGSFKRTFTLPRAVKAEKIAAHMKDGVLFVQMPKAAEAKTRKIVIKSEN